MFGFRPDLSQCEHKVRCSIDSAGNKRSFTTHESIAMDVASSQNSLMEYCPFRELGLWNPYFLWYSLETDKVTAQYIFAALAYGYDSDTMALELLRQFHSPQHRWDTQISHVCRTVSCLLLHHSRFGIMLMHLCLLNPPHPPGFTSSRCYA